MPLMPLVLVLLLSMQFDEAFMPLMLLMSPVLMLLLMLLKQPEFADAA